MFSSIPGDLLHNHARAIALRGRLIGAGFDPITVAYNETMACCVAVVPRKDEKALSDWIMAEGIPLWDVYLTADEVTVLITNSGPEDSK